MTTDDVAAFTAGPWKAHGCIVSIDVEADGQSHAVPRTANDTDRASDIFSEVGMSLRDWFAGQALVGLCVGTLDFRATANTAYAIADAMIALSASNGTEEA